MYTDSKLPFIIMMIIKWFLGGYTSVCGFCSLDRPDPAQSPLGILDRWLISLHLHLILLDLAGLCVSSSVESRSGCDVTLADFVRPSSVWRSMFTNSLWYTQTLPLGHTSHFLVQGMNPIWARRLHCPEGPVLVLHVQRGWHAAAPSASCSCETEYYHLSGQ